MFDVSAPITDALWFLAAPVGGAGVTAGESVGSLQLVASKTEEVGHTP